MDYLIGVLLALSIGAFAAWIGFDKTRSFYPVVLIVIASYYVLFAVMEGSGRALVVELLLAGVFAAAAVAGFKLNLWLVVMALLAHAALDVTHDNLVSNPGVPAWWPAFCLAFDVAAAGCLALRMRQEGARALEAAGAHPASSAQAPLQRGRRGRAGPCAS